MEVAPAVRALEVDVGAVMTVLDRHDALATPHELRGERHGQRGLPGVLPSDYRDEARACHDASASARSFAVFTLKKASAGSTSPDTDSMGRIPTLMKRWKPIARRSPSARHRSMAGRHAGPYAAQSGSTPRGPPLDGQAGVGAREAVGQRPDEGGAEEGHVPGDHDHGCRTPHDGGVDAAQRPESGAFVGDHLEIRAPGRPLREHWRR